MLIAPDPAPNALPLANRRTVVRGLVLSLLVGCSIGRRPAVGGDRYIAQLREIEGLAGGRLGAYIFDIETGDGFGWRENERFAHCSSFKMSLAAMVLSLAERGNGRPRRSATLGA